MLQENPNFAPLDWEKLAWEQTPYQGVFLHKVEEELDPDNSAVPKYTIMALKLNSLANIPPHRHNRESGWTETIVLPHGGQFDILDSNGSKKILTRLLFSVVIHVGEVFGIRNTKISGPLYFYSIMRPGFTGYQEIEEVKN